MPNPKFCPYCGSNEFTPTIGAFLEIGAFANGAYALEGDAECFICNGCQEKFWVNGPGDEMCYALVNSENNDVLTRHPATPEGHSAARLQLVNTASGWCDLHDVPADVRENKMNFAESFDEVHLDGIGTLVIRIMCMED